MTDPRRDTPTPPLLIAAFEGWSDAGNSASQAVAMLGEQWDARVVHEVDPEGFHDFQVTRPLVVRDPDGGRYLEWPSTTISTATSPQGRRIVLVEGIEPSFRWRTYCAEILGVARDLGVETVVTVGALLADVPHSRPLPVQLASDDGLIRAILDLERSQYEGPTGITGVFDAEAAALDIHTLSVWVTVPHYVAQPPSPKATLALMRALEPVIGEELALGELAEDAKAWQTGVDELASSDPDIASYVAQLEEAKDTADLPEATGDAIAEEFERYLRRRDDGAGPGTGPGHRGGPTPPKSPA